MAVQCPSLTRRHGIIKIVPNHQLLGKRQLTLLVLAFENAPIDLAKKRHMTENFARFAMIPVDSFLALSTSPRINSFCEVMIETGSDVMVVGRGHD